MRTVPLASRQRPLPFGHEARERGAPARTQGRKEDVLPDPDDDQPSDERSRGRFRSRPERDEHEQPGEQRGRDQRIGAAMGIFRKRHAFRKPGAAPQKGQIETVLEREQAVEENEREGDGGDRNARKAMIAAIIGSRKEHADPAWSEAAPHKHH